MAKTKTTKHEKILTCTPAPLLTFEQRVEAQEMAAKLNPVNLPAGAHPQERLAVLTQAYWGAKGVDLTVGFMEQTAVNLRDRIISHMNAWNTVAGANVKFHWTQTSPQVRISRQRGGYWSYLGVDILSIPRNQQTMNLEGFTMNTPESEFVRVIRHETGHTLGFPHEHLRRDLVALLDAEKTIAYFMRTQGWTRDDVIAQVLTPVEEGALLDPTRADGDSIMCYQLPGSITKSGQPIKGGSDLDELDKGYALKIYPSGVVVPPVQPPPTGGAWKYVVTVDKATGASTIAPTM